MSKKTIKKSDMKKTFKGDLCLSTVEQWALGESGYDAQYGPEEKIPSIIVPNFPSLGRLTAVRFLEWVLENPEGVVSLPTGKTPEYFIKFVLRYLATWNTKETKKELGNMGVPTAKKPDLTGLNFVQIDEWYPIDTRQHNSFFYYVNKYYIKGFGLDPQRALFINPNEIGIPEHSSIESIFPDGTVDITLRVRRAKSLVEKRQKSVVHAVDQFCTEYEHKIREMGGLGFFLGGIGPDGHIAFNVKGADFYSTTRLCRANYETKAAAAGDLGGMEVSRHKHVVTIGLRTITYNKDAVGLVIAAGEAKAHIVKQSIESELSNMYPASCLQKLPRGRFYLTHGAAKLLSNRRFVDFKKCAAPTAQNINQIVMDLSFKLEKPVSELKKSDFQSDRFGAELLKKEVMKVEALKKSCVNSIMTALAKGNAPVENKRLLHTAPHHDDIILAYLPYFTRMVRFRSTHHHFTYLTSGFNAVTNEYMHQITENLLDRLKQNDFRNLLKTDYFDPGNLKARNVDSDIFLQGAARHHDEKKDEGVARRYLRNLIDVYEDDNIDNIQDRLVELHNYFATQYPGKKDITLVQQLKGRCREFESDLKWAYYGFTGDFVHHLRLGFYKGDIFSEQPTMDRDIPPIVNLMKKTEPDIVTVAFDPEGSGPDTHYKVLQAVSEALRIYSKQSGRSDIKVLGYRNVWFKYHPCEVNMYVPTSLTHLNDMEACFDTCFTTQRKASFPSYEYDGPFSFLARKIQCKQYEQVKTMMGEDFFVHNDDHLLRAACAIVYLKEMNLDEFFAASEDLKNYAEHLG